MDNTKKSQYSIAIANSNPTKIYIIKASWHKPIVEKLYTTTQHTLIEHKLDSQNIYAVNVPGSYELPLAAQWAAKKKEVHAIIVLGCIIKGETPHFDFISKSITQAFTSVALQYNKPIISGVLTTYTYQQALDRTTGVIENKGKNVAIAALEMIALQKKIEL